MIGPRHRDGGQVGRDLLHQRTKPRLDTGILVQQVREPPARRSA
jgi:hypothetical protein